jgi:uncharacterized protein YjbI with pentapeptide repeats
VTKPLIDLKPANSNPWYVLMTLHGEQDGNEIDEALHKKNVQLWNSYMGPAAKNTTLARLESHGLQFTTIKSSNSDFLKEISERFHNQWRKRFGDNANVPAKPGPNDTVDLSETNFEKLFSVNNMYFKQTLNFSGSKFKKDASFIECGFCETVDLSKVEITGKADFSHSGFISDFVAKDMKVLGSFVAEKVFINGDLDLSNVRVTGSATLNSMQIEGRTTAVNGIFKGKSDFDHCKFNDVADFEGAVFKGDIVFRSATFVNLTKFILADFHGDATFASSIFEKETIFRMTVFCNRADFTGVQFKGITDFSESKFHTKGTELLSGIRFTDAIFSKSTSFRQCLFAHSYPEFTNSDIYPVTDFSAEKKFWPSGITSPKKDARESCGIIRNLLAKKGLAEDQHFFFRREMMFTSHHETFLRRIPYQVYRCLSDYGDSIARPLLWILGVWILGFALLWGYFAGCQYLCLEYISVQSPYFMRPPTPKPEWNGLTAAGLSFSNLFPLYGFGGVFFKEVLETLPPALKFVSGFQTVISLPLLFLLGLGLRQRFRLS